MRNLKSEDIFFVGNMAGLMGICLLTIRNTLNTMYRPNIIISAIFLLLRP